MAELDCDIDIETDDDGDIIEEDSEENVSFSSEILLMMHACGDVAKPVKRTAELIDQFVFDQLSLFLSLTAQIADERKSGVIGIQEVMFLLRRNIPRLFHFMRHLQFRDVKGKYVTSKSKKNGIESVNEKGNVVKMKRTKTCLKFLKCIDKMSHLEMMYHRNEFEDIRMKRIKVAEFFTRNMNLEEYSWYSECRVLSFAKKMRKFKLWLQPVLETLDISPNRHGWESFAYLAHETVAELVYLCLLVQADQYALNNVELSDTLDKFERLLLNKGKHKNPLTSDHIHEVLRRCSLQYESTCNILASKPIQFSLSAFYSRLLLL